MKNTLLILLLLWGLLGCKSSSLKDAKSEEIIETAIKAHGGKQYENLKLSFDFRKFKVKIQQTPHNFIYLRSTTDTLGHRIIDSLNQGNFFRSIDGKIQELSPKDHDKYKEAVNSIAYFMLLPYKLRDPAVIAKYMGQKTIEGKLYDKVKVSFRKEGGGKDYTDSYCYWFDNQTHLIQFLSYTNGGPRFRKVKNRTQVKGMVFQDYDNYEILDKNTGPENYDEAYAQGKSKWLSEIVQTNYTLD
jgi:hypothetical protein